MSNSIIQSVSKPVNFSVRLVPDLSAVAFRTKTTKELALWHALRAINTNGSGYLYEEEALELLKDFGYSRRTIFRTLKSGEGQFWTRFQSPRGSTIEIYGLKRVFSILSTYPFNALRHYEVPADRFNTIRKRRLALWESLHKCQGVRANPISRQSLSDYTTVKERTQQRYDNDGQIKKTAAWRPGYHDEQGKPMPRMGNIYHNRQSPGHIGQLRKVRRSLKSLKLNEAVENRRYFPSNRAMVKTTKRDNPSYILVRSTKRQIYGRIEYQAVLSLC